MIVASTKLLIFQSDKNEILLIRAACSYMTRFWLFLGLQEKR
jgi:hypothetical protein